MTNTQCAVSTSADWDWLYPPCPQFSCTCGPSGHICVDRQLYVFSSCSGCAEDGSFARGPLRLRPDSTMLKGKLSRPNSGSLFLAAGVTSEGQLHSLTRPGSLHTKAPHSYWRNNINPESCSTFSKLYRFTTLQRSCDQSCWLRHDWSTTDVYFKNQFGIISLIRYFKFPIGDVLFNWELKKFPGSSLPDSEIF